MSSRPLVVVVLCHFLAAFSILGMSPYYATILERSLGLGPDWGGLFYVIPLLVMAVTGPFWGRFADRFGRKLSLLRAQLGLSLALYLCSLASTPASFALCLVLQGLFGGTFSASNALLSEYYRGQPLAGALSYLQYSARLGLFLAPSLLGVAVSRLADPQRAYAWLWLLPMLSFALLQLALPAPALNPEAGADRSAEPARSAPAEGQTPFALVLAAEFSFTWITVMTFPYFVKFFQQAAWLGEEWSGVYFGVPHAIYLMLAFLLIPRARTQAALPQVACAFAIFSLAMVVHLVSPDPITLLAGRILMGLALVLGYVYLNQLFSQSLRPASAGRLFGWLDTASKFAGVIAGLSAGAAVRILGVSAPFGLAALIGAVGAFSLWAASRRPVVTS